MANRRSQRRRTSSPPVRTQRGAASRSTAASAAGNAGSFVSTLLREGLSTLREQAGTRVGGATELVRDTGEQYLTRRKERAAEQLATVGDAVRLAADKL